MCIYAGKLCIYTLSLMPITSANLKKKYENLEAFSCFYSWFRIRFKCNCILLKPWGLNDPTATRKTANPQIQNDMYIFLISPLIEYISNFLKILAP